MTIPLDPGLAAALAARAEAARAAGVKPPPRGDALGLRAMIDGMLTEMMARLPAAPDVTVARHEATADDGAAIELRWYTRAQASAAPGSAVVYIHGGGLICGTLDNYEPLVRHYTQLTGVPFLAVGYRLAPEHPGTGPARDALAGIRWLVDHAAELGVDPARIALMGDSGGGAVGASATILARDQGMALARQILIFPMLDDRNVEPDPLLAPTATWTYGNNFTGWNALLGEDRGTDGVPPEAAAARLVDFAGLPPAYIEVGELDIFRDEDVVYAQQLWRAGVSCELHVHPGAPHGHDWLDLTSDLNRRVLADRVRVIASI